MAYDISMLNSTNVQDFLGVVTAVNDASGNLFGMMFLIALFIGFYALFKRLDTTKEILISSFLTGVVGVLLLTLDIVTWEVLVIPVFGLFISFMVDFFR